MVRREHKTTPIIQDGRLYTDDDYTGLKVGSAEWFAWLALGRTFYCGVTFRCEVRRNGQFWYAYKRIDGKLRKKYVGRSETLTCDRMFQVANLFDC